MGRCVWSDMTSSPCVWKLISDQPSARRMRSLGCWAWFVENCFLHGEYYMCEFSVRFARFWDWKIVRYYIHTLCSCGLAGDVILNFRIFRFFERVRDLLRVMCVMWALRIQSLLSLAHVSDLFLTENWKIGKLAWIFPLESMTWWIFQFECVLENWKIRYISITKG